MSLKKKEFVFVGMLRIAISTGKEVRNFDYHQYNEEHHVPIKKLEPKYDYEEPFSFKEKKNLDGGNF